MTSTSKKRIYIEFIKVILFYKFSPGVSVKPEISGQYVHFKCS